MTINPWLPRFIYYITFTSMDSKKIAESQVDEPWHTQFKITITWKHKLHTFSFAICYDYAWIVTHILCSQLIILVSL